MQSLGHEPSQLVKRLQPSTFEEAFTALAETVKLLETGGLTLEESLEAFERGMALYGLCKQLLESAEQRVIRLVDDASLQAE